MIYARPFLLALVSLLVVVMPVFASSELGNIAPTVNPYSKDGVESTYTFTRAGSSMDLEIIGASALPEGYHYDAFVFNLATSGFVARENPWTGETLSWELTGSDTYNIAVVVRDVAESNVDYEQIAIADFSSMPGSGGGEDGPVVLSQLEGFEFGVVVYATGLVFGFFWLGVSWLVRLFSSVASGGSSD